MFFFIDKVVVGATSRQMKQKHFGAIMRQVGAALRQVGAALRQVGASPRQIPACSPLPPATTQPHNDPDTPHVVYSMRALWGRGRGGKAMCNSRVTRLTPSTRWLFSQHQGHSTHMSLASSLPTNPVIPPPTQCVYHFHCPFLHS